MMTTQTLTTPSKPISKKGPPGKTGGACPSEARVYIKIPYSGFEGFSLGFFIYGLGTITQLSTGDNGEATFRGLVAR